LANAFQSELEKHFLVVQWDQRGSGKSFPNTSASSMTVAQFEADTHELVLWLRQHFQRDKIYLLGHSWGTYLGLAEAQQHPENL
ncbi:alpha/beta fold hydrolase, partial [Acinetobacter baumannii]